MPKPTDEQMVRLLRVNLTNLEKAIEFGEAKIARKQFFMSGKWDDGEQKTWPKFLTLLRHKAAALRDILEGKAFVWKDEYEPKAKPVAASINLDALKAMSKAERMAAIMALLKD